MQTTPITTSTPGGQARAADGAGGKPGGGTSTIFAGLIQALAGGAYAAPVPAAGAAGQAAAAEGEVDAQPAEGESDAVTDALAQVQGLEHPPPPQANPMPPVDGAAAAAPGAGAPQAGVGMPAAPAAPAAASTAAGDAPGAESDAVPPASAQAVELAKVLGAGTQIRVTHAAEAPTPAPVQNLAAVAVAAALGEAPVAAVAEPALRPSQAPQKKPSLAAAVNSPGTDGGTTMNASAAPTPARPAGVGPDAAAAQGAQADHGAARPAAAGSAAPPSPTAAAPGAADGTGQAPSAEPAQIAFGRESQTGQSQPPAPAAPMPERAQAPAFAAPRPPANQVSVHFAKAVRAGVDRIEIQLAPASLGRVDISLDLSDTQQVRASISVETKEALELLRADARVLERALQDAGLKTDPGSLSFQLRDQGARAGQDGGARQGFTGQPGNGREADDPAANAAAEASARQAAHPVPGASGRIDIHA